MFPLRDNIPTDRTAVVTIGLMVVNVVAYLLLQPKSGIDFTGASLDPVALAQYGAIPYEFANPGSHCEFVAESVVCERGVGGTAGDQLPTAATVLTSMFTHGGLLHLAGNMLFLWIFGNNLEDSMGPARFLAFYVLAGVAALALQIVIAPSSTTPTLGASGAIAGVLGGYLVLYPRARVLTIVFLVIFFTFIEIPALFFLLIWFGQQALFGALDLAGPAGGDGGVAYFAHIGGFLFGLAAVKLFAQRRSRAYGQPRYPVY